MLVPLHPASRGFDGIGDVDARRWWEGAKAFGPVCGGDGQAGARAGGAPDTPEPGEDSFVFSVFLLRRRLAGGGGRVVFPPLVYTAVE